MRLCLQKQRFFCPIHTADRWSDYAVRSKRIAKIFNQIFVSGLVMLHGGASTVQRLRMLLADRMTPHTQFLLSANPILSRFALNRPYPVRNRLSWTCA